VCLSVGCVSCILWICSDQISDQEFPRNQTPHIHHSNPSLLPCATNPPPNKLFVDMISNKFHKWFKNGDLIAAHRALCTVLGALDQRDLIAQMAERDKHGRTPLAVISGNAQKHSHILSDCSVLIVLYNFEALATRDNKGETPLDIARRSGACAEIIGLLSITPEEARSLGGKEMNRLYAPVGYWQGEMYIWIKSRSYADCHKFINEHDDELVREVLKFNNSNILRAIACKSQLYSDSLVFLALQMIHRHPLSLTTRDHHGQLFIQYAEHPQFNACREIQNILRLTPLNISSTPFPTLLRQHLPKQFVDEEVFGTYNTACTFIKHMKYDKAELVEIEAVLKPARKCDVCSSLPSKPCARCKCTFYCSPSCQKLAWKKHKKTCRAPTSPPATEAELRDLHKGIALLNMCIQRPGAGDGPTSVVVDFLKIKTTLF